MAKKNGVDTDTEVVVTGGLVGLLYRSKQILYTCIDQLARKKDIEELCERIAELWW